MGGLSFLVDYIIMSLSYFHISGRLPFALYISATIGFLCGNIVNYALSRKFVFESHGTKNKKALKGFGAFIVIGIIGLLITEFSMYIGTILLGIHYGLTKIIATIVVLFWNYFMRMLFAFDRN